MADGANVSFRLNHCTTAAVLIEGAKAKGDSSVVGPKWYMGSKEKKDMLIIALEDAGLQG